MIGINKKVVASPLAYLNGLNAGFDFEGHHSL